MNRTQTQPHALRIVTALIVSLPAFAQSSTTAAAVWRDPGNVGSLNLVYGPGGEAHKPGGKFTFVKEDKEGSSTKFEIVDENGVRWKAKLGEEVKSETAAARLLWAAGYFTDEDYYVAELRVGKMPKLDRGGTVTSADGLIHGVRLERIVAGQKKSGNWSWFKNPFVGTKELSGLKIMMAMINNWDLKEVNNGIYTRKGAGTHYSVTDLGASFGETGDYITRSKSNAEDYGKTKFVQKVTTKQVDFYLSSRPFVLTAVAVPNYITRTKMQDVVKDIPLAHAKWLGKLLVQLSDEQIRDCFRAAGYSAGEIEIYASTVKERITDLNSL